MLFSASLVFLVTLITSLILTPLVRRFAIKRGWFDIPNDPRRVHSEPTPRIGGAAMYVAFVVGVVITFLPPPIGISRVNPTEPGKIGLLLIGCTIMAVVMFVDDVRGLRPRPKLGWQFLAAAIVMVPSLLDQATYLPPQPCTDYQLCWDATTKTWLAIDLSKGILVTAVQNPFSGAAFNFVMQFGPLFGVTIGALFTFFWIMGMVNTVNWMDGLDGLAAGITAVASVVLLSASLKQGQTSLAFLPLILGAAVLGFLPFNFSPARIFMGDTGAMFLGFALGVIAIIGGAKIATALLVLGVPILDVAYVIIFRLIRGKPPMQADRGHLHHRFLDLGMSHRQICLFYYIICGGFGALALIPGVSSQIKLAIIILMAVLLASLLVFISRRQFAPQQAKRKA